MPVRDPRTVRVNVVLDKAHDRKLDELARQARKSRSAVIRDAVDRLLHPVPDADFEASGTHRPK